LILAPSAQAEIQSRREVNIMPTARKKETVKELEQLFENSEVLIFTDYRGLRVADITNLRRQLRDKGVEYHVSKNTLTTLAARNAGLEELEAMLDGPTAIAFLGDDIPGAAKVLADFARTSSILQIRGGMVGRTQLSADQVSDLQKILPREQYIAKIMGSLQSPMAGMVGVLSGVLRSVLNVMQARVTQMKEQGLDGEAAPAPEAEATAEVPTAQVAEGAPATEAAPVAEAPVAEAPVEVAAEAPAEAAPEATTVETEIEAPTETATDTEAAVEEAPAAETASEATEEPEA
jgi:large subunit ribosomal protein L10